MMGMNNGMVANREDMSKNTILSSRCFLTMDTRESGINNNVVLVGSSGSGKTRRFVKPNLLQKNASYIISDPKGALVKECGGILAEKQDEDDVAYKIKVLNLIDLTKSMHYNPFKYIRGEEDILALVGFIMANNSYGKRETNDSFWVESATELLTALIGFVHYNSVESERNFNTVLSLLDMAKASEESEKDDDLDLLFNMQEKKHGNCFSVRFYKKYRANMGRTKACIISTLTSILAPWELSAVKELVRYDELELDSMGDGYTALFVIVSDMDDSKNFLAGILYSQLLQILCYKADNSEGGRLKVPVRCFFDDFACVGKIPRFEKVIASVRSREISICIILQNESQLDSCYGKIAPNILGNCDTYLFMGSNDLDTCARVAQRTGKKVKEMLQLPANKCWIFSGQMICIDEKYKLETHPRFSEDEIFDYMVLLSKEEPVYVESKRETKVDFKVQDAINIFTNNDRGEREIENLTSVDVNVLMRKLDEDLKELESSIRIWDEPPEEFGLCLNEELKSRDSGNVLRSNFFDSQEEEIFYRDLTEMLEKYHFTNLQVDVHVHLSEIFSNPMSELERNKYKYRLVNQHCDFVIRDKHTLSVIAGIEIDGEQHVIDMEQRENDQYKNETFRNNGIPLLRIKASEARANWGWRNKVYQVLRQNNGSKEGTEPLGTIL